MTSAADVVVLSSTPDHKSTRTLQQASYHSETPTVLSLQFDSPASLPSPSELFRQIHNPADLTPQDAEKDAARKTTGKRGRRKITDELQTVLTHAEPAAPGSKDNASKKVPKTKMKRTNTNTEKKREGPKNKTLTGRVSKASSADPRQSDAKKPSFSKFSSQGGATKNLDDWEASGLHLEEATIRRLDWTPTKDTGKQPFDLELDGDAGGSQMSGAAQNFSNLLAGYGFIGAASSQPSIQENENVCGPTKRRRIDLMDSRIQAGPRSSVKDKDSVEKESQQKPKKRNKKFTTLTARVTARYAPGYTEDSINGSPYTADAQDHADIENADRKRNSKKKKKPQEPEFIVLSPEAAVKSLEDQDLMFGTCSQLEREDSPTTLRVMQTAIKESESYMKPISEHNTSRTSSGSTISRFTGPRSLWSEAFRDLGGALAQAEVLDLVDECDLSKISPRVDCERRDAQQQETPNVVEQPVNTTHEKESSIPGGNSDALGDSSQVAYANSNQQSETASVAVESRPQMPQYNAFTEAELSKQVASYGFKAVRGRQKMIDLLQKCWESKHGTSANPNEDGLALIKPPETSKDRKTTGTSNKTSCSKSRSKTKSTANPPTADDTSAKPPARRGQGSFRPTSRSSRKVTESFPSQQQQQQPPIQQKPSYADVEEIQDSEDEAISSPNQLLSRYFTQPKPSNQLLAVSPASSPTRRASPRSKSQSKVTTTFPGASEEDDEPDLGTQITKAVRVQPSMSSSAGSRKSPSWHEKILMYDPIVLEDFTTWLNTEGLGLVYEDREVDTVLVREWCESKGICCCYKNRSW